MVRRQLFGYIVAVVVTSAATVVLKALGTHVNPITVALALLLIVLFVATAWGPKPAIVSSLLGVACFNFFFLPPLHTFVVADPENWIALFAFLITAITVGQLSAHAKRRAAEANAARKEIERLYLELQDTFEQASQTRALKQSEQLKSALLDAVTHDLRTPLTSIKASVTTLLDDQRGSGNEASNLGDEGRQEMLEVIDEESDRLDRFIAGLMELARSEAGESRLRRHRSSINEIILAGLKRAEPRTRLHRVESKVNDDLPLLNVDEPAIVEVLYVLLDNAAKYSRPGSLITVSGTLSSKNEVILAVEDQGSGISVDLRNRVFDKFFRASSEISQDQPTGTGMGLAIAQGIVEAHGGRIWVEDGSGGTGVRMLVALPANTDAPES